MGLISVRSEVQLLDGPFGWQRRPRNGFVPVWGLAFAPRSASLQICHDMT